MQEVLITLRAVLDQLHQNLNEGLIVFESDQRELERLTRQLQAVIYEYELFDMGN